MTLTEFANLLTTTFPKAQWELQVHAETRHTPAYHETVWGKPQRYPEVHTAKVAYDLTFQDNFFEKNDHPERFAAPSLTALWETVKTTYAGSPTQTLEEVEGWLKGQE